MPKPWRKRFQPAVRFDKSAFPQRSVEREIHFHVTPHEISGLIHGFNNSNPIFAIDFLFYELHFSYRNPQKMPI